MKPPNYTSLPTRFWDKVEAQPNGCWEWQAAVTNKGYGTFQAKNRTQYAHRLAAADAKGVIPVGLFALHHCDNPPCVYPDHLYYGTAKDNAVDAKKRGRWTHGEVHASSKLTEKKVLEARRLYSTGDYKIQELADKNGVHRKAMSWAIRGLTWRHARTR